MKRFWVSVNYDTGRIDEFYVDADNEDEVYAKVYGDIGYDPGDVYVEEVEDDQ